MWQLTVAQIEQQCTHRSMCTAYGDCICQSPLKPSKQLPQTSSNTSVMFTVQQNTLYAAQQEMNCKDRMTQGNTFSEARSISFAVLSCSCDSCNCCCRAVLVSARAAFCCNSLQHFSGSVICFWQASQSGTNQHIE